MFKFVSAVHCSSLANSGIGPKGDLTDLCDNFFCFFSEKIQTITHSISKCIVISPQFSPSQYRIHTQSPIHGLHMSERCIGFHDSLRQVDCFGAQTGTDFPCIIHSQGGSEKQKGLAKTPEPHYLLSLLLPRLISDPISAYCTLAKTQSGIWKTRQPVTSSHHLACSHRTLPSLRRLGEFCHGN